MWNSPTKEELSQLPAFYATERLPLKEKIIHEHFFIGGSDWYACEYSPEERLFFGFVILNQDYEMAEWGYFSLSELLKIKVKYLEVDRDLFWRPRKAEEVTDICKAQGWIEKGDTLEHKINA